MRAVIIRHRVWCREVRNAHDLGASGEVMATQVYTERMHGDGNPGKESAHDLHLGHGSTLDWCFAVTLKSNVQVTGNGPGVRDVNKE